MKFRNVFNVLMLVLIAIFVVACSGSNANETSGDKNDEGNGNANSGDVIKITFGGTLPDDNPLTKAAYKFKEELEERTDGKIEVEVFPNMILGGGREMLESLQQGNLTMVDSSFGPFASFDNTMTVFNLPFLFNSREAAYDFLDNNEVSELMKQRVEENTGMKVLAYWENGFRHLTTNVRPINTVEDLKDLKIRTMENPVHMEAFEMWGANPTPMAFNELYSALQQGVVDGQENPLANTKSQNIQDVQKYLTISHHFYDPDGLFINADFYNNLSEDLQQAIDESALIAADYNRQLSEEADETLLEEFSNSDTIEVVIMSDEEKARMREMTLPLYEKIANDIDSELIQKTYDAIEEVNAKYDK